MPLQRLQHILHVERFALALAFSSLLPLSWTTSSFAEGAYFEPGGALELPQPNYNYQGVLSSAIFVPGNESLPQKTAGLFDLGFTKLAVQAFFRAPFLHSRIQSYFSLPAAERRQQVSTGWRDLLLSSGRPISDSTFPLFIEGLACPKKGAAPTATRAASLIQAANNYRNKVRKLEENTHSKRGSSVADSVFGAARQPRKGLFGISGDTIVKDDPECNHVVVFSKNVPYIVELPPPDNDGNSGDNAAFLEQILIRIQNCANGGDMHALLEARTCVVNGLSDQVRDLSSASMSAEDRDALRDKQDPICNGVKPGEQEPVGVLGDLPRNKYAATYDKLKKNNADLIKDIECALMTVSLDEGIPGANGKEPTDPDLLVSYGRGRRNPGNRWVGKGLNMTVTPYGVVAECEHAIADGGPCGEVVDGILIQEQRQFKALCDNQGYLPKKTEKPIKARAGSWNLEGMNKDIANAQAFRNKNIQNTQLTRFNLGPKKGAEELCLDAWTGGGEESRAHVKQRCMNGNATFQMAHFMSEYEGNRQISIAEPVRLSRGRLGFNLTNTPEARRFADKARPYLNGDKPLTESARNDLRKLLLDANIAHERGINDARQGLGPATPLLGIAPLAPWAKVNGSGEIAAVKGAPAWLTIQQRAFGNRRILFASRPEQNISNMGNLEAARNGEARRIYGGSAFAPSPNNQPGTNGQAATGFMIGADGSVNGIFYGSKGYDVANYEETLQRNRDFLIWIANGGSPPF